MRWAIRTAAAAAVVGVLVWFPGIFGSFAFSEDLSRVEEEARALEQGNVELTAQIVELEAEIRALHDAGDGASTDGAADEGSPGAATGAHAGVANVLALREVERIAREDLNLIRPGEVVFEVHGVERFTGPRGSGATPRTASTGGEP